MNERFEKMIQKYMKAWWEQHADSSQEEAEEAEADMRDRELEKIERERLENGWGDDPCLDDVMERER